MAYNEDYYKKKREEIEKRFLETKDTFIMELMKLASQFQDDTDTIKAQHVALDKKVEESKNADNRGAVADFAVPTEKK